MKTIRSICCAGTDDPGIYTCGLIASKCPEIRVTVIDTKDIISEWNNFSLPLLDPEMKEIIKKCRNTNLFFTSNYKDSFQNSEVIFISFKMTKKAKGEGSGKLLDMKELENWIRLIDTYSGPDVIIVDRINDPIKIADTINTIFSSNTHSRMRYEVLLNPPLFECDSIKKLLTSKGVVIGYSKTPYGKETALKLSHIYSRWLPIQSVWLTTIENAEQLRLFNIYFSLQDMSFEKNMKKLCSAMGANFNEVKMLMKKNFKERAFPEDLDTMIYSFKMMNLPESLKYWQKIWSDGQKFSFLTKIFPTKDKVIALWGIFPSEKDEYYVINICKYLLSRKAILNLYDPVLEEEQIYNLLTEKSIIVDNDFVNIFTLPYESTIGASYIIIMKEFDEISKLKFEKIVVGMKYPTTIIDLVDTLKGKDLQKWGFHYLNSETADLNPIN